VTLWKGLKRTGRKYAPECVVNFYQRHFVRYPVTYDADGLRTVNSAHLLTIEPFASAFDEALRAGLFGKKSSSFAPKWRAFVCVWAARQGLLLGPGDLVEFGVWKGGKSSVVMKCLEFEKCKDRKFYLFDTFEGIVGSSPEEIKEQGGEGSPDYYRGAYPIAVETFRRYSNAVIVKGIVPETLPQLQSEKICYVSIDMNAAAPEIAAAEYVWPRMITGALMVLDDYGGHYHRIQRDAFDDFARRHSVPLLELPTGQGIIMKPALAR
jgi:O-methyltransferase